MANIPGVPPEPAKTWLPTTAGVLCIVAGTVDLFIGLLVSTIAEAVGILTGFLGLGALGLPLIILGVVAIIGGIFALRREVWGLALAGAICALIWPLSLLGLLAVIFLAVARREFK